MTIGIDIANLHAQPKVDWLRYRITTRTAKQLSRPRHTLKLAIALIQIKGIRFTKFNDLAIDDFQSFRVPAGHDRFPAGFSHRERSPIPQQRQLPEIGHVQIQVSVPVHITQRHRGPGSHTLQAHILRHISKHSVAIVVKAERALAEGRQYQV